MVMQPSFTGRRRLIQKATSALSSTSPPIMPNGAPTLTPRSKFVPEPFDGNVVLDNMPGNVLVADAELGDVEPELVEYEEIELKDDKCRDVESEGAGPANVDCEITESVHVESEESKGEDTDLEDVVAPLLYGILEV